MKKAKKTAPAVGNAPIGGEFSLPALSAPSLNPVWVTFGSDGKVTEFSIGKSSEYAEKSG